MHCMMLDGCVGEEQREEKEERDQRWYDYRDVKAPNLVVGINEEEDNGQIYMLDFGFARRFR